MKKEMYIAKCEWYWRDISAHKWRADNGDYIDLEPENCRVSIGKKFITVWLPKGARIRCAFARHNTDPTKQKFYHYFGRNHHERIVITVEKLEAQAVQ